MSKLETFLNFFSHIVTFGRNFFVLRTECCIFCYLNYVLNNYQLYYINIYIYIILLYLYIHNLIMWLSERLYDAWNNLYCFKNKTFFLSVIIHMGKIFFLYSFWYVFFCLFFKFKFQLISLVRIFYYLSFCQPFKISIILVLMTLSHSL